MKLLCWLAVGCVATAGLVLAFTAGVWCVKSTNAPTAGVTSTTSTAPATVAKATTPAPQPSTPLPPFTPEPLRPITPVPGPLPENHSTLPLPNVVPINAEMPVLITPVALPAEPAPQPVPIASGGHAPQVTPLPAVKVDDSSKANEPPVRYVNKPDLEFEYDVGKKGKSGVKAVSLFVRDTLPKPRPLPGEKPLDGPTNDWKALVTVEVKDDAMPKLKYTMPAAGRRFEFRLGVTSGNGNVSKPKESDPPDLVVVLDTTPQTIKRFDAAPDTANPNKMILQGVYADANLGSNPSVVFEYRTGSNREWTLVQTEPVRPLSALPGTVPDPPSKGEEETHVRLAEWVIPDDAPAEVAFRVTVTDLAGNVATKVIEKVSLDTTIPEGKLTKVRTVEPAKKDTPRPPPIPPRPPDDVREEMKEDRLPPPKFEEKKDDRKPPPIPALPK